MTKPARLAPFMNETTTFSMGYCTVSIIMIVSGFD